MKNEKRGIKKLFGFIIALLPLLIIPTILSGMEVNKKSESHSEYILKVKGDHISLKAKDASLKDILEEIGRRMKIEVIANITREQKITIELDMMYLGDALKRFKTNYAYITKTEKQKGNITKIVVVPKGGEKILPNKSEYNPQPPIQKFEHEPQPPMQKYDPQPPIKKFEHESQPTTVRSGHESQSSSTVTKKESQSSPAITENESQSSSAVTENESESSSTATENESQPTAVESNYDPQPSIIEKK